MFIIFQTKFIAKKCKRCLKVKDCGKYKECKEHPVKGKIYTLSFKIRLK